jgi:DNA-binding NarL/FixJ family response regulator
LCLHEADACRGIHDAKSWTVTDPTAQGADSPGRPSGRQTCLLVEDEALIRTYYEIAVEQLGFEVVGSVGHAADAVELAVRHRPTAVLMDIRLAEDDDGVAAAEEIYRRVDTHLVFVTASTDPLTMQRARRANPAAILIKPVRIADLAAVLP